MEKPVLLIADSDPAFAGALKEALGGAYHVRCCQDGREALALLRQLRPEMMVLDLTLPELDGFAVLRGAAAEGLRLKVLATTPLSSEFIQTMAEELEIDYVMRKPCNIPAMTERIGEIYRRPKKNPPALSDILRDLGFPPTLKGTRCLPFAAQRFAQDPAQLLTKEFYPEIGKQIGENASGEQAEKWIRYAIGKAWDQGNKELWHHHFPQEIRPTNRAFFVWLVEVLEGNREYP